MGSSVQSLTDGSSTLLDLHENESQKVKETVIRGDHDRDELIELINEGMRAREQRQSWQKQNFKQFDGQEWSRFSSHDAYEQELQYTVYNTYNDYLSLTSAGLGFLAALAFFYGLPYAALFEMETLISPFFAII